MSVQIILKYWQSYTRQLGGTIPFEKVWFSHVESTLFQVGSLQALACLLVLVCQALLLCFESTSSNCHWIGRVDLLWISFSILSVPLKHGDLLVSTFYSRPGPALGLLGNLGAVRKERALLMVWTIKPDIWAFPTSPATYHWLSIIHRQGQSRGYVIIWFA